MLRIEEGKEAGTVSLVLEKTIFHPQGGGQPSDQGFIALGDAKFVVSELKVVGQAIVHTGKFESESVFEVG